MQVLIPPLVAGLIALLGVATPLNAQDPIQLRGRVIEDETDLPVAGANVELLDRHGQRVLGRAQTADDGTFGFTLGRDDGYRLRASRIGYRRATTPVLWTDGYQDLRIEIRLDPEAVLLAPLEVTARSRRRPSSVLDNFRARQRSGLGHFFTRADIERIRPALVTDLLNRVPGIHLASSGRGAQRTIYMSRSLGSGRDCPAQIYVDGFLLNRRLRGDFDGSATFALDDAVSPETVEGIEVYQGLSGIPAEFLSPDARCGVVAVWTRRGDY